MMKHTPKPWHINGYYSDTGIPASISGAGGEPIAALHRLNPDTEANARLIIAAPKMLSLLCDFYERAVAAGWHPDNSNMRGARELFAHLTEK